MLKIICISDTHGRKISNMPSGDVLIHSGDWSSRGTFDETLEFLNWMDEVASDYDEVLCVPGNHDRWIESNLPQAKDEFKQRGLKLLVDDLCFYEGTLFYGMPWTPQFGRWSFMGDDEKRRHHNSMIPPDTNVLITHGPPLGFLDKLASNGSSPGSNVGCVHIRNSIIRLNPLMNVFGHIHEGSGVAMFDKTLLVNAAVMNEYYHQANAPKVVYI